MGQASSDTVRADLGGLLPQSAGTTLIRLVQVSDAHVLDAASPARAEWVELLADDPRWRPLLHLHRPYDALAIHAFVAHVAAIEARGADLVVLTGDNIDNAQRNELDAYLAVVAGGSAQLSARGSAQDARPGVLGSPWPFWSPDGSVEDTWRALGYPVVDDFVERASARITSTGLTMPWTSLPGNHDLMRQGTALTTAALEAISTGTTKSLTRPPDFEPTDPLARFLDEPEQFSAGPGQPVLADPDRRAIDRREWIEAHLAVGALGYGRQQLASASIDTVVDTEHVRLVLLDTNHPAGDYQGSIGAAQLSWLDDRLAEVDREGDRVAIVASHHGAASLVNHRGASPDRRHGHEIDEVLHRHPSAIAWLVGHRHVNRIEARPGAAGGFWEVTTCSTIDWPSQTRAIDVVRHRDGTIELACTMLDHRDRPDGLATLHRDLARRFATTGAAIRMAGRAGDGDVRLVLPGR